MKKIWIWMILSALFLGGCGADKEEAEQSLETSTVQWDTPDDVQVENPGMDEKIYQELQKSLVMVDTGELCGNGMIWEYEEDMVIVTAGHVLEQVPGAIHVTLSDGYTITADLYWNCTNSDLAFLKIEGHRIPRLHQKYYGVVPHGSEAFNKVQPEAALYAMGYRGPADILIQQGTLEEKWMYVEAFEQFMVSVQALVVPGMSGGGLFDETGHCIGVICGTDQDSRTVAVPSQVVDAELISLYW